MTETIRYSQIGKEDIRFGTGTFEVTLADGRVVVLQEVDLRNILGAPFLPSYTYDTLLAVDPVNPGRMVRLTDNIRGIWIDTGTAWHSITGYADSRDWGTLGNGTADDTAALNAWLSVAAPGVRLYWPKGVYKITATIGPPDMANGYAIITDAASLGIGLTGGVEILWAGAANETMYSARGGRWWSMGPISLDGANLAGHGIYIRNGPGTPPELTSEFTLIRPHVINVTGTPGYALRVGHGDAAVGICCFRIDQPELQFNNWGLYFHNGGMQDINIYEPLITDNIVGGVYFAYGAGPINFFGGSMSALPGTVHFYFVTGSANIIGLIAEHGRLIQWDNHNALNLTLDGVWHNSGPGVYSSTDSIHLDGGEVDISIKNTKLAGNLNATNFNTGVGNLILDNLSFQYGTFIPPSTPRFTHTKGTYGYHYGVEPQSSMGVTSKTRILSVGTTLATDLVTDGDAEAVGMASWPSVGTPATAEKNTTTPIAGTQDIHILTDGTPYTFQGVYQSFAGTYGPGHIFKISWKHRIVQGSFRVNIAHGGAGVVWNSIHDVDDEYAYPLGRDINEYHEQYWVSGEDGDVDVWFVGYGAGVNEFYVDDIVVKEVTAGGMIAGNEAYFTNLGVTGATKTFDSNGQLIHAFGAKS